MSDICFVSYRDPKLEETLEVFEKTADYIASLELDERQVRQFVIGALSKLKKPKMPYVKGFSEITNELCGIYPEMVIKIRRQLIDTTLDDLKGLADIIREWLKDSCVTVIGSEQAIKDNASRFDDIQPLL